MKHFYSHLIEVNSLTAMLSDVPLSDAERKELLSLVESNIHHTILDLVLSELSEKDKQTFLGHLAENKHDAIWRLLKQRVADIEVKIQKAADELKKKLRKDIMHVNKR